MSESESNGPRFLDAGDTGLVIELGDEVSEAINAKVIALADALAGWAPPAVQDIIPTYRSILVVFDPLVLARDTLIQSVLDRWPLAEGNQQAVTRWRIPVCYGGVHGIDLEPVAERHGMTPEKVITLHSGADYRVYMLGFSPGFAYLGGLPEAIHTSRLSTPRAVTPPRTISIGGKQAAISPPMEAPSGWHLLGQTPVRSYDPQRSDRPFLFEPGDIVRFEPIGEAEYREMCSAAESGIEIAVRECPNA